MKKAIAIQGIQGSFHHQVAAEYFGKEVTVKACDSFPILIQKLTEGKIEQGIMAIENSIAGSILPNYALIDENSVRIVGEHYIPIHMNLMALEGQSIEDIQEVRSHPIALLQCKNFFDKYPHIKLVEDNDTADVARKISEEKLMGIAAVASKTAAAIFGLNILEEGIHTVKNNSTRFLILSSNGHVVNKEEIDKVSLKFELDQEHGNLASVLNILNDCNLNLTKIQSLPIIEFPWKYSYFIDVTFLTYSEYEKAKDILSIITQELKVLGEYKNGRL